MKTLTVTFLIFYCLHFESKESLFYLNSAKHYAKGYPITKQSLSDTAITPHDSVNIIAPGATVQLVSSQFSFTEGPATNKKGDVYFTDQPNDKIWKYGTDGKLSVFLEKSGRSNGLYFDKKGNLISCADEKNELWSIKPSGKVTVLLKDFKGARLNGPNDLWVDSKGGIYFTDP